MPGDGQGGNPQRFLGSPDSSTERTRFTVLGAPMATVYRGREPHATGGPAAVRLASGRLAPFVGHHDFDTGRTFAPWHDRIADVGDVPTDPSDPARNRERITAAVAPLLARGVRPVVIGGDDSVAIPFLAAFADHGPVTVVQLDAHLDFRDDVNGERFGYSSPMRRATEMPWVHRVVHVGLRGVGSARVQDVEDSRAAGNTLVTTAELLGRGARAVASSLSPGEPFAVVLDCDVAEPSQVPAVRASSPGGVPVSTVGALLQALAERGEWRGLVVTELEPELDLHGISALAVVRWITRLLDAATDVDPARR